MGRVTLERNIHFNYYPEMIEHYKIQSQEMKDFCDEIGRPYGYTAMNVFYMFFYTYWSHLESGVERKEYKHSLE